LLLVFIWNKTNDDVKGFYLIRGRFFGFLFLMVTKIRNVTIFLIVTCKTLLITVENRFFGVRTVKNSLINTRFGWREGWERDNFDA